MMYTCICGTDNKIYKKQCRTCGRKRRRIKWEKQRPINFHGGLHPMKCRA
jgi:hypothetical protein